MAGDRSDVGSRLRAAREARGISLRDIAATTKISVSALEALERNDASRLPGGLFSRAFVRAYAKEVGLDPEQTAREFGERFSPDGEPAPPDRPDRARRSGTGTGASHAGVGWLGLAITVVLVIVWVGVDRYYNRRAEGQPGDGRSAAAETAPRPPVAPPMPRLDVPTAAVALPETPAATPAPAATGRVTETPKAATTGESAARPAEAKPAAAAPPAAVTPGVPPADAALPLHLVLAPRSDCWLSLSVDGKRVAGRTVKAGEKLSFAAGQSIVLTAGDAGALDYSINNAPGRALGAAGQVVTVVINPANYQTFLASRPPQ